MGRFLEQCIKGVLYQNYSNWEHIVIDGLSQDETLVILKKYPHLKWISEPDSGLSNALNKGIRMATGDIIGWCCADDYYLPGAFKVCIDAFQKDPSLMFLYGDYRNIDADGRPQSIKREIGYDPFILKYGHMCYIATPAAFWRKSLHDNGLMFNEDLHYSMDSEFILRCVLAGHRFQHIPTLLCDFRVHSDTKSANPKQRLEHEEILRSNLKLLHILQTPFYSILRRALLGLARSERTLKRAMKGCYIEQWWRT